MGLFSKTQKQRDKEFSRGAINEPDALAFYYMDTMLCYDHQIKYDDCMAEYDSKWRFSLGRRKLHR